MPNVEPGLVKCSSTAAAVVRRLHYVGRFPGCGRAPFYLCQAEIENLGVPALGDEDIRGLDVTVNNAAGVRRVEGIGDLDAQRKNRFQLHRAIADQVLECDAVEKLHDKECAIAFLANVVNRADIGMIQR